MKFSLFTIGIIDFNCPVYITVLSIAKENINNLEKTVLEGMQNMSGILRNCRKELNSHISITVIQH